jgi:hypothetical protein
MDITAKPLGTFSLVEPWITRTDMNDSRTSAMNADAVGNLAEEAASYPFGPNR